MAADEDRAARRKRLVEHVSVVLLASAAVATAWASYQANQWHGQQALAASKATAGHVAATRVSGVANRQIEIDVATFIQWVNAYRAGDRALRTFYYDRFRPEFRPAVAAWVATRPLKNREAPLTPFQMPQYHSSEQTRAAGLEAAANVTAARAKADLERADQYVLCVVLFATSLFFAGISTRLKGQGSQAVVLGTGCVLFLVTLAWMLTFRKSVQL